MNPCQWLTHRNLESLARETIPASIFTAKVFLFTSKRRLWGGVQFEGLDPPKMPQDKSVGWWDNKETRTGQLASRKGYRLLILNLGLRNLRREKNRLLKDRLPAALILSITADMKPTFACDSLLVKKQANTDTAHSARPASFVTPQPPTDSPP